MKISRYIANILTIGNRREVYSGHLPNGGAFFMQTAVVRKNANLIDVGQGFTQQDYLDYVHGDSTGYIAIGEKIKAKSGSPKKGQTLIQYHYKKEKLMDRIGSVKDTYFTPNTFYLPKRKRETAREIGMFYVDIDFYNTGFTREQVWLKIQLDILPNHNIPMPTFVIDSGRGMYLQWKIQKAQGKSKKVLNLWEKIERVLLNAFKEVGADTAVKDIPRFLRIPGSINTKTGRAVKIIEFHDVVYQLDDLQYELLPDFEETFPEYPSKKNKVTKKKTKKRQRRSKASNVALMRTPQNLHYTRMKDLETLVSLREGNIKEGRRELFLFYYRYLAEIIHGEEKALEMALMLNEKFRNPLDVTEVEKATKSTDMIERFKNGEMVEFQGKEMPAGYNYKNSTLIQLFSITEDEQKSLNTIISKEEKQRRNTIYQAEKRRAERKRGELTPKQREKQERQKRVAQMTREGFTQKQIAETLGVSVETVKRDIKQLKEQTVQLEETKKEEKVIYVQSETPSAKSEGSKICQLILGGYDSPAQQGVALVEIAASLERVDTD